MRTESEELFTYLLAGLTAFAEKGFHYPYPETLLHARGLLIGNAIQAGQTKHQSISEFLQMVKQPIRNWWPLDDLPHDLEGTLPLLYEDGQIPDFAIDWLLEKDQHHRLASVNDVAALAANRHIAEICERLRIYPQLQADYVDFRRFLIENPWLDAAGGLQIPGNVYELMEDVLNYYERVTSPNLIHKGRCWQCPRCKGILHWVNEQPHCASALCERLVDLENTEPLRGQDILTLQMVFRRRVQLPGLIELKLFNLFSEMTDVKVDLWPDGDRYDLRVETSNATWQLDVKDYSDPVELAVHLRQRKRLHPGLEITYVIPAYRNDLTPGYVHQLRSLVPGILVLTDDQLVDQIKNK